jgi:YD repeat-containing protein
LTPNQTGNLTQTATSLASQTAYAYDLGDRLTGITPALGSSASFSLDVAGRFKTRSVGSATDTYSYLGNTETVVGIPRGSADSLAISGL